MKRIFQYFKPRLFLAIIGISFVAGSALIELYQIQMMGQIIDVGIQNGDMSLIYRIGFKMIGFSLLGIFISVLGLVIPATVTTEFAHRLRTDLYEKIQGFSVKNMNKFQTASLVTRLTNDVDFLQRTALMSLRMLVRAPVLLVSTVSFTYMSNKFLSRVPLVAVIALSFVMVYVLIKGFPRFIFLQEKLDGLNRKIQESLINVRVIKSFVREDMEEERFSKDNQSFFDASMRAHELMLLIDPALQAAINFATIGIMYFASFLIIDLNVIAIGDLLVFVNYLRFTMFSMMMITNVFMMMTRSKASLQRINEVFDEVIDIRSEKDLSVEDMDEPVIEFKNVSFKYYEAGKPALENINLKIYPSERLGIIGSTGSGKSSLVNLLSRLMDVSEGEITINHKNIKDFDLKALRSLFGFVPQTNILFKGTIASNLRLGNEAASDSLLELASHTASIDTYIHTQEMKYESPVQQGGSNFSGGQRQRLCIARALVMEPKILILDDSTSALDAQTEQIVMQRLNENYPDLTILSIAQKISSVASMDRIVVLNEGRIVGLGKHEDLLLTCDIYKEIYDSQIRNEVSI